MAKKKVVATAVKNEIVEATPAKTIKSISFDAIDKLMNYVSTIDVPSSDIEGLTLHVKPMLTMEEAYSFSSHVCDTCFDDDCQYMPELYDFAVKIYTAVLYGGIRPSKDHNKAYRLIYATALYDDIIKHVNLQQYSALIDSCKARIEYRVRSMESQAAGYMSKIMSRFEDTLNDGKDMLSNLSSEEVIQAISSLTKLTQDDATEADNIVEIGDALK